MNKLTFFILIVIASCAVLFAAVEFNSKKQASSHLQAALADLSKSEAAAKQQADSLTELTGKMEQMAIALNDSTAKLKTEREQSAKYKTQLDAYALTETQKQDRQQLADQEPVVRNGDTITFPILKSPTGATLMTSAEFRKADGRKLVFKSGLAVSTFDVDELHPGALIQLGINPDEAKSKQIAIDQHDAVVRAGLSAAAKTKLSQDAQYLKEQAVRDAAQAKLDEKKRQQDFQENLQQQSAANERTRAQAALREANAAMIRAQNPY